MHVQHQGRTISYLTPSVFLKWRVDSLMTKEPCTIDWIADQLPALRELRTRSEGFHLILLTAV